MTWYVIFLLESNRRPQDRESRALQDQSVLQCDEPHTTRSHEGSWAREYVKALLQWVLFVKEPYKNSFILQNETAEWDCSLMRVRGPESTWRVCESLSLFLFFSKPLHPIKFISSLFQFWTHLGVRFVPINYGYHAPIKWYLTRCNTGNLYQ